MSVTIPDNSRGPILDLTLPSNAKSVGVKLTNATTGKSMMIDLPAGWNGDDLTLDFFRQTIKDQNGDDRSSLLSTTDNDLWIPEPLVSGPNDLNIEAVNDRLVIFDIFNQTAGNLHGKAPVIGSGTWATSGATVDLAVDDTTHTVTRWRDGARIAIAGTTVVGPCHGQFDWKTHPSVTDVEQWLFIHYVDSANFLALVLGNNDYGDAADITLRRRRTGSDAFLDSGPAPLRGTWQTLRWETDASGLVKASVAATGDPAPAWAISVTVAEVATGGVLDDGKVGFSDSASVFDTEDRSYDNLAVYDTAAYAYSAAAAISWEIGYY